MGRKQILFGATNLLGSGLMASCPWLFGYVGPPAWNDWTVAYVLAVIAAAVLTAGAEWHAACVAIGAWLGLSPWLVGVPPAGGAILHILTGAVVCALALAAWRRSERTPPFWYRPGGALRELAAAAEQHGEWVTGDLRAVAIGSFDGVRGGRRRSVFGRRASAHSRRRRLPSQDRSSRWPTPAARPPNRTARLVLARS